MRADKRRVEMGRIIGERQIARRRWVAPAAILIVAIVLRIVCYRTYAVHHPDELFQYLEQAHRIAFGYGIVPWEYRYGMRPWIVPLFLSGPMRLGNAIAPGGDLHLIFAQGAAAIVGLVPVGAAYAIGARWSRWHGLVTMAVLAVWYESVYFSLHVLTEMLALGAFLPAAALLARDATKRRLLIAGFLLGLTVVVRVQYAPAVAVFALIALGGNWRAWPSLVAGGLIALAFAALVDVAMGQAPFGWAIENVRQNLVHSRAAGYGVDGPLAYWQALLGHWWWAMIPIFALMLPAIGRYPALFWAAIVNIGVHMLIGHKEYRFILLSTEVFILLAAIGSAELVKRLPVERRTGIWLAITGWSAVSATLALNAPLRPDINRFGEYIILARHAGQDTSVCGLATYEIDYWGSGGYAYVHRAVPLYLGWAPPGQSAQARLAAGRSGYNAILAPVVHRDELPLGYNPAQCAGTGPGRLCLYRRPGPCVPGAAPELLLQNALNRADL